MVDTELHAMLSNDERHWWYRGRRRILCAELDRVELPEGARALDAGCGSGRTLDELAHYATVSGVDLSEEAVAAARARGHDDVRVGTLERLPFPPRTFDLITCLDVLEHVPDDVRALRELRRVARPGAALVVTVPAYQALWSAHDEANLHYRRYRRAPLRRAAIAAGWQPARDTHFNWLALAPAAVVRLATRNADPAGRSDLERTPRSLDRLLELPLDAEAVLLRHGGRIPFGLSILAVFTVASNDASRSPARRHRDYIEAREHGCRLVTHDRTELT
jgi:SAM-dependent methyltransferase